MVKVLHFFVGALIFFCVQACTERAICPAYQSAFIHDKSVLDRHFSYFGEDTMPKIMEANKDQFLIIEPMTYKKKLRTLEIVPMLDVYPKKADSLDFDDEFYLAEREGYDSTAVLAVDTLTADSAYMISLKREKFNIDQQLYLWYLRNYLVYPDVRLHLMDLAEQKKEQEKIERRKKGIRGFFKNLFKKKEASDSTVFDIETSATKLKGKKKKRKSEDVLEEPEDNGSGDQQEQPQEGVPPTEEAPKEDDGEDDF